MQAKGKGRKRGRGEGERAMGIARLPPTSTLPLIHVFHSPLCGFWVI